MRPSARTQVRFLRVGTIACHRRNAGEWGKPGCTAGAGIVIFCETPGTGQETKNQPEYGQTAQNTAIYNQLFAEIQTKPLQ